MTSTSDLILIQKYKTMLGLDQIDNISDINKVFNISQITNLQTYLNTLVNITNSSLLNNITINSNLYVSGTSVFQGNISILGNLNISNNTFINNLINTNDLIINNNSTIVSNLIVNGNAQFNNLLQTNIITGLNNNIDILANNITIGSINSIINIYGTTNYIFKNSSVYQNKTLVLNYDVNSEQAIDTGTLSGIVIKGIYNDGYIKTSTDASRFLLRTPNDIIDKYIATTDINNNLFISGTTVLNDNVTINSNLFVAGITNIQNMTVRSQLYAANECIINGDTTINSNLFALYASERIIAISKDIL